MADKNAPAKFVRERRDDLGLTQERLAELIGETATQAEVSRLERGVVAMPRRGRMEHLAVALEVSLGALLIASGWLTEAEGNTVDERASPLAPADSVDRLKAELRDLQESLSHVIHRIATIESLLVTADMAEPDEAVGRDPSTSH